MNLCQKCNSAQATVHLTEIDPENHKPHEMHLCEECARDTTLGGDPKDSAPEGLQFSSVLSGLQPKASKSGSRKLVCGNCGLSFQEFRVKGRFGCAECYDTFLDGLLPLLEKVHGSTRYVGPRPREGAPANPNLLAMKRELVDLRRRISFVVDKEDYEEAARLRDRIEELESKMEAKDDG